MAEVKVPSPLGISSVCLSSLRCQCARPGVFKVKKSSGIFHLSESGLQVLEDISSGVLMMKGEGAFCIRKVWRGRIPARQVVPCARYQ